MQMPVLSLYLNMAPDQHGKDRYEPFLRRAFAERSRTLKGDARKSFERDVETMETLRQKDAENDAGRVKTMLDSWHAGGLGVVGPDDTMKAMVMGAVEELLIPATPERLRLAHVPADFVAPGPVDVDTSNPNPNIDTERHKLADELVTKAQQTGARIRFVEDPKLLDEVGGVGAILRFRI